ncbi:MAG: hypothetical protein ACRD03_14660 [Acidimicrobiales bacterium]
MLGPLRVLGVRVLVAPEGSVIEAVGVLHRRPVTQRVSAATAAELVSRGASLVLRQPSGDGGRPGQGRPATVPEGR